MSDKLWSTLDMAVSTKEELMQELINLRAQLEAEREAHDAVKQELAECLEIEHVLDHQLCLVEGIKPAWEQELETEREENVRLKGLVLGAIWNSRAPRNMSYPRWTCVMTTFGCGSTRAYELCKEFGKNPEEVLTTDPCDGCPVYEEDK